ncbi:ZIP family metal transporter [Candidatus Falkowbacteria bacterium]|nr:ZIP family metal transporter [Candidatus Falkowbacteria bacterium]
MLYFYLFLSLAVISAASLVGVVSLRWSIEKMNKINFWLISIAAGSLIGDSFFHLLPETVKDQSGLTPWIYLTSGLLSFFVLEKIIHWRHCHIPTSSQHPHPLGTMNIVGDFLHNFLDGLILANAFLVNPLLGLTTALAIFIHEIPQEISDFGILLHAGYSRIRAIRLNFLSSLSAFLGALLAILFQRDWQPTNLLAFTAGSFIYIATADLLPEMQKETTWSKSSRQLIGLSIGLAIMLLMKFFLD